MANKKFSEFTLKTDPANVDFVVGYDGTDNVRIDPSNIGGGGGATNLNELTDCLVDTDSLYVGEVPAGLSGNPQGNTVLGSDAGRDLTSGANNTFLGNYAGLTATTSVSNVAIGVAAGQAITDTSKQQNVCIGFNTFQTAAGTGSVVVGFEAGRLSAASNSAHVGYQAGWANAGGDNASLGYQALLGGGGGQSIGIGTMAGKNNTSTGHISVGYQAGFSQTSGTNNTNLGYKAGYANTTGVSNVAIGYEAGRNNTGGYNTLIGVDAARAKTTGSDNVAVGFRALYTETSGQRNTAIGYQALQAQNQQFAAHNTAVGWQADDSNTTGYYRTNIGASTGGTSTGSNITNIGFGAQESSSTVSNEVTLGNSSVATLRCAVTSITSLSDERDKTEIKDLGYGLAFIDALQPREFVWDNRPETNKDGEEFYSSNKGKKDFGFIAQEVKELDNDTLRLVYDENPDKLELSYGKLVPVLVQAIKELKEEIELLKSQNK